MIFLVLPLADPFLSAPGEAGPGSLHRPSALTGGPPGRACACALACPRQVEYGGPALLRGVVRPMVSFDAGGHLEGVAM